MSKAILVMDMPDNCSDCKLLDDMSWCCGAFELLGCDYTYEVPDEEKPDWCPLKPMPEYDSPAINPTVENTYYAQGWNDCIDEILKGGAE